MNEDLVGLLIPVDGDEVGAWIKPGLGGEFGAVSQLVPKIFDAYARVFRPASDEDRNPVTWAEVAARLGRVAHREMQFDQIAGIPDTFAQEGPIWPGETPETGEMEAADMDRLCAILAAHIADPDDCFIGYCWIDHSRELEKLPPELRTGSDLHLPYGRDHAVFAGPLSSIPRFRWSEDEAWGDHARVSPNLVWPADLSWFVVSEVDFDSTLVGGGRELIDALVAAPGLEVYEVEPDTSLAAFADKLNPVGRPEED
jgi:hypothetical protein